MDEHTLTGDATRDPRLPHSSEVIAALAAERDMYLEQATEAHNECVKALRERDELEMLYHSIPNANQRDRAVKAEAERDALKARVLALEEALRMVEFPLDHTRCARCPWCHKYELDDPVYRHKPDCPRQLALKEATP